MVVVTLDGLLPVGAPGGRAFGRGMKADGRAADHLDLQIAAADKAQRPVVEVVGAEIVHGYRHRAGAHERVDVDRLVEEQVHARGGLVGVVAAHHAGIGCGVVRLADAREQQQAHVVDAKGAQHHNLGRLENLFPRRVHIGHAARALFVRRQFHTQHVRARADLEVLHLHSHGQDADLRRGLGEMLTAKVGTEPAVHTGAHVQALGIHIRARTEGRGLHIGVIAQFARGFAEQRGRVGHLHGRIRIGPRAPGLKGVAAFLLLPLDVTGLAGGADQIVVPVEIGLQLVIADGPVLAAQFLVENLRAIALGVVAADAKVGGIEAVVRARPVVARAAQVRARIRKLPAAHGQRLLVRTVAKREGFGGRVLVQFVAAGVLQFVVDVRALEIRGGPTRLAAFQHHHPLLGRSQLLADDGTRPAAADDRDVHGG
ncbi:hypothetical protein D3C71_1108300 [compost metagenome]